MSAACFSVTYFTTLYLASNQVHTPKDRGDAGLQPANKIKKKQIL
jgi:hypothetical protein